MANTAKTANSDERPGAHVESGNSLDLQDVVRFLRGRFGDQYPESYEHGKREIQRAIQDQFGLEDAEATELVDQMERAQTIRFRDKRGGADSGGPRLGLFDEPRSPAGGEPEPEFAGHYWEMGRDAPVQGAW